MLAEKKKQRSLFVFVLFPFWSFIYAILTIVSWFVAFANDEGTINEFLGTVGHYCFLVFRFPSHNFWDDRQFVMDNYFVLLLVNALLYSLLTTVAIALYMERKAQRNLAAGSPKGLFSEDVKKNGK